MANNKPKLTIKLVAANDKQYPKVKRNPVDPRLVSLARILTRQETLGLFASTSDLHPANDTTLLPPLISESKAAQTLNVCIDTLRRERRRGHIGYIRLARKIYYSELQLMEYLECQTINPIKASMKKNALKSETSGYQKGLMGAAKRGTEPGSTQKLDKHIAHLLAQQTFQKQN